MLFSFTEAQAKDNKVWEKCITSSIIYTLISLRTFKPIAWWAASVTAMEPSRDMISPRRAYMVLDNPSPPEEQSFSTLQFRHPFCPSITTNAGSVRGFIPYNRLGVAYHNLQGPESQTAPTPSTHSKFQVESWPRGLSSSNRLKYEIHYMGQHGKNWLHINLLLDATIISGVNQLRSEIKSYDSSNSIIRILCTILIEELLHRDNELIYFF